MTTTATADTGEPTPGCTCTIDTRTNTIYDREDRCSTHGVEATLTKAADHFDRELATTARLVTVPSGVVEHLVGVLRDAAASLEFIPPGRVGRPLLRLAFAALDDQDGLRRIGGAR